MVDIQVEQVSTVEPQSSVRHLVRSADQELAVHLIVKALEQQLRARVDEGLELTGLGDAEDIAAQIIDRLPIAASPWPDVIGPVYSSGSLQRELGVGRQAVSKAVAELRLLRLTTADGHTVYPAFQVRDGAAVRGIRPVLSALQRGIDDPWTWAQWLAAPEPVGRRDAPGRHIDRLLAGDVETVVRDAERTAASWAA